MSRRRYIRETLVYPAIEKMADALGFTGIVERPTSNLDLEAPPRLRPDGTPFPVAERQPHVLDCDSCAHTRGGIHNCGWNPSTNHRSAKVRHWQDLALKGAALGECPEYSNRRYGIQAEPVTALQPGAHDCEHCIFGPWGGCEWGMPGTSLLQDDRARVIAVQQWRVAVHDNGSVPAPCPEHRERDAPTTVLDPDATRPGFHDCASCIFGPKNACGWMNRGHVDTPNRDAVQLWRARVDAGDHPGECPGYVGASSSAPG